MLHETCVILAETLSDPTPCLPPGFSGPVSTALGWVKALSLVIGVVALVRIGVHILRQQGDGVPDRDDTFDKLVNWVIGIFLGAALSPSSPHSACPSPQAAEKKP